MKSLVKYLKTVLADNIYEQSSVDISFSNQFHSISILLLNFSKNSGKNKN